MDLSGAWKLSRSFPVEASTLGRIRRFQGHLYSELAELRQAFVYYDKAIRWYRRAGDSHLVGYTRIDKAGCSLRRGEFKAAEVLIDKGAKSVRALCTHPVLSGKAYESIENSKLKELIVCDTIPLRQKSKKIKVLSSAKLFSRAIRNTHEQRSISALFVEG